MIRPGSAVSRQKQKKAAVPKVAPGKRTEASKPDLQEFLNNCDYTGAITLLEFEKKAKEERPHIHLWLGFCYFHNGDYRKAVDVYEEMLKPPCMFTRLAAIMPCASMRKLKLLPRWPQ